MKRVNQYSFYQLGTILHPLSGVEEGMNLAQAAWDFNSGRVWLNYILNNDQFNLVVSRTAALDILNAIDSFLPKKTADFSTIDPERKLNWAEAYRMRTALSEFETVFAAECPTWDTYVVSKKGIYSTAALVERAEMAIDEDARKALSKDTISDFKQAGRCLAFELATAAGFHTMRAVEGVVRTYWRLVKGQPATAKAPDLAVCINELRAAGEDPKLMDILDHIRDLHRNTLMHPEAFLTMTEALRLFDIAKSAISAIGDKINSLSGAAANVAALLAISSTTAS
jgi:hypothetical protein